MAPSGAAELVLKATPPRTSRDLLLRQRLASGDAPLRDRALIVVQAPAGFGKTSLIAPKTSVGKINKKVLRERHA